MSAYTENTMKPVLKNELLVLVPESPEDEAAIAVWKSGRDGHVLALLGNSGTGAAVKFLGPREDVCREPINVTSRHPDPQIKLIGNFADTPFELDGERYGSVEGFWQGLRFPERSADRRRIAELSGSAAKRAGEGQPYGATVKYRGEEVPVGTWGHWQWMHRACHAKFTQNYEAMSALMATGERPLVHKVRKDSRTIPGVIMADIWMRIRATIQAGGQRAAKEEETESDADE